MHNKSIFIFRRDLRLHDNIGLLNALKSSKFVIPVFIFTPEQVKSNRYKSNSAIQFMITSLLELNESLKKKRSKLYTFYGKPSQVIKSLKNIDAVFVNKDYTPYSTKRDNKIKKMCKKHNIKFITYEDILLNPAGSIRTGEGNVYTKFTPYHNKAKKIKINKPIKNNHSNYYKGAIKIYKNYNKLYKYDDFVSVQGGRKNAIKILRSMKKFKQYNKKRNMLTWKTTHLSAYIKFGCVSIREVYHYFKKHLTSTNDLFKQLYWRDFYYNISYYYPHAFGYSMKKKYDKIKWNINQTWFNKWCKGNTGYPIVDAAMRELNQSNFMHNRGRLIVSNFLIKLMGIDWRKGEKYFAQNLVDYDPCVNNGNWQWSASSGADSQPYFRIFNPWSQAEKHDPNCEYIKKWIPELKDVPNDDIHKWYDNYKKYNVYVKPVLDYKKQRMKIIKMYKKVFQ
jgi:deoxyribodipyrimidine photo-lyase